VAQLYLRALGSLLVASYDSQGSDGGILTRLHTEQYVLNYMVHKKKTNYTRRTAQKTNCIIRTTKKTNDMRRTSDKTQMSAVHRGIHKRKDTRQYDFKSFF
jgi:hypothetical protein